MLSILIKEYLFVYEKEMRVLSKLKALITEREMITASASCFCELSFVG